MCSGGRSCVDAMQGARGATVVPPLRQQGAAGPGTGAVCAQRGVQGLRGDADRGTLHWRLRSP